MASMIELRKQAKRKWMIANDITALKCCSDCKQSKPLLDFWDGATRSEVEKCGKCLHRQRQSNRSTQEKSPIRKALSYAEYMTSPEWKQKRWDYWRYGKYKCCYVCADPWVDFQGKQLHHRTYERLGNELLSDLVPVCPGCHDIITQAWKRECKLPRLKRRTLWQLTEAYRLQNP